MTLHDKYNNKYKLIVSADKRKDGSEVAIVKRPNGKKELFAIINRKLGTAKIV